MDTSDIHFISQRVALDSGQRMRDDMAEPVESRDLDTEAEDMAHNIIGTIAVAVAGIHDPRDRLAAQVGRLQGMVRKLCLDLAYAQADE